MTAQNEEKMREDFQAWCERTRQARAYHSGVIVVEPTDDNYCIWKAAIAQGEQERKQLRELVKEMEARFDTEFRRGKELEAELAKYKDAKPVPTVVKETIEELKQQLAATELVVEQMRVVLQTLEFVIQKIADQEYLALRLVTKQGLEICKTWLQLQPSLSVIMEDRAKMLEEAKRRIYNGEFNGMCAEDALQSMASELRAKGE